MTLSLSGKNRTIFRSLLWLGSAFQTMVFSGGQRIPRRLALHPHLSTPTLERVRQMG